MKGHTVREALGRLAEDLQDKISQKRKMEGLPPVLETLEKQFEDLAQFAYTRDLKSALRRARDEKDKVIGLLMRANKSIIDMREALRFYAFESWEGTVQNDRGEQARQVFEELID